MFSGGRRPAAVRPNLLSQVPMHLATGSLPPSPAHHLAEQKRAAGPFWALWVCRGGASLVAKPEGGGEQTTLTPPSLASAPARLPGALALRARLRPRRLRQRRRLSKCPVPIYWHSQPPDRQLLASLHRRQHLCYRRAVCAISAQPIRALVALARYVQCQELDMRVALKQPR